MPYWSAISDASSAAQTMVRSSLMYHLFTYHGRGQKQFYDTLKTESVRTE